MLLSTAFAQDGAEMAKIDYLISSIGELKGVKFIRNGSEHDGPAAVSHLRLKLKAAGKKIKTAEDFIQCCASRSSISGKPYLLRLSDGTVMKSEIFFRNKLKEYSPANNRN